MENNLNYIVEGQEVDGSGTTLYAILVLILTNGSPKNSETSDLLRSALTVILTLSLANFNANCLL